ncbi:uncharacterized protein BO97DRAFT_412117 [Aspergillus homomorphus CBS 101889]|uniref:t-SNARE coiled-coil homology domain-containing protein n=1 Tax=Aspergillus homomorphus (strain CBS 101889) TaxID=1450537 RepID=A0A395I5K8_ASPHC|nr:hypothetical protein BO97DRAFT_412117 [Aspergillus homomorphus CBS 101889]RAL14813.1 hypothetical protein BO97DRAFT_412117 [Aspergillus homomorphus CBS 101889]
MSPLDGNAWAIKKAREKALQEQQGNGDSRTSTETAKVNQIATSIKTSITTTFTGTTLASSLKKPSNFGKLNLDGELAIPMPKPKRVRISDEAPSISFPSTPGTDDEPFTPKAKRSFTDPIRRFKKSEKAKGDPGPEFSYWEPEDRQTVLQMVRAKILRSKLSFKDLHLLGHKPPADPSHWVRVEDYLDEVSPGWRKDIEEGIAKANGTWRPPPEVKTPPNPKYPNLGIWRAQYPKNHKPCTWTGPTRESNPSTLQSSSGGIDGSPQAEQSHVDSSQSMTGQAAEYVPPMINKPSERYQVVTTQQHRTSTVAQYKPVVVDGSINVSAHQFKVVSICDPEPSKPAEYKSLVIDGSKAMNGRHSRNTSAATNRQNPCDKSEYKPLVVDGSKRMNGHHSRNTSVATIRQSESDKREYKPLIIDGSKRASVLPSSEGIEAKTRQRQSTRLEYESLIIDGSKGVAVRPSSCEPAQSYSPSLYGISRASSPFELDLRDLEHPQSHTETEACRTRQPVRYSVLSPHIALAEDDSTAASDTSLYPNPLFGGQGSEYFGMQIQDCHDPDIVTRGGYAPAPPDPQYQNTVSIGNQLASHMAEMHYHVDKAASRLNKSFEDNKNWNLDRMMKQVDEMSDIARLINSKTIMQAEILSQTQRMVKDMNAQVDSVRQEVRAMESRLSTLVRDEVRKLTMEIHGLKINTDGPHSPVQEGKPCTGLQGPDDVKSGLSESRRGSMRRRARLSGRSVLKLELQATKPTIREEKQEGEKQEEGKNEEEFQERKQDEGKQKESLTVLGSAEPVNIGTATRTSSQEIPRLSGDLLVEKVSECTLEKRVKRDVVQESNKALASSPSTGHSNGEAVNPADYPNLEPHIAATMRRPDLKEIWGFARSRNADANATTESNALKRRPQIKIKTEPAAKDVKSDHSATPVQEASPSPSAQGIPPSPPAQETPPTPSAPKTPSSAHSRQTLIKDPRDIHPALRSSGERQLVQAIDEHMKINPLAHWEDIMQMGENLPRPDSHSPIDDPNVVGGSKFGNQYLKAIERLRAENATRPEPLSAPPVLDTDHSRTGADVMTPAALYYSEKWTSSRYHSYLTDYPPGLKAKLQQGPRPSKSARLLDLDYSPEVMEYGSKVHTPTGDLRELETEPKGPPSSVKTTRSAPEKIESAPPAPNLRATKSVLEKKKRFSPKAPSLKAKKSVPEKLKITPEASRVTPTPAFTERKEIAPPLPHANKAPVGMMERREVTPTTRKIERTPSGRWERMDVATTFRSYCDPHGIADVIPDYRPGMFDNDPYAVITAPKPPRMPVELPPPKDLPPFLQAYHDGLVKTEDAPHMDQARGKRNRDASIYVPEDDDLV